MTLGALKDRIRRPVDLTPAIAITVAFALVAAALGLAVYNERLGRAEEVRQTMVQARILAGSLAAPLAFDDGEAAGEYVNALKANPNVEAVGAYGPSGDLVASFVRAGPAPAATNVVGAPQIIGQELAVTLPVTEGSARLGSVYLRTATETPLHRAVRYVGIGLVVLMAAMLIAVLGASNARVNEAHRRLQAEVRERERAEEALRQAQKMEAMGQLTGGVAHDFNNLLMAASGGLDLMDRTTDPARRERLKQGIRHAIERGASLTQQLLAFARKAPLHPEIIDPGERLRGMQQLLERSLREDIVISLKIAPDLWSVETDPSQLEGAVLNIALNARDAMPNGGMIEISLENRPADGDHPTDMVEIRLADQGVGMAPDVLNRVFEPFFTTKGVGKGTGLGLSQVYGFAQASGGQVRVESELNVGTTLSLLLPRAARPVSAPAVPAPEVEGREGQPGAVLLVEDDDTVAELVADMLRSLGYRTERAATAETALERLLLDPGFDLVFSDMVMPGDMNGLDLAREIAVSHPELPIVLTTGYSEAAAAAAAQGIRLLVKPYQIDALAAELGAALRGTPRAAGSSVRP